VLCLSMAVLLSLPGLSRAQRMGDDMQNPNQYNDVEDGQLLKFASYILMPIGMGLEWGLTRPLHYVATQTPLAPILSGDNDSTNFGEANNAANLPAGTFGRYEINPAIHAAPSSAAGTIAPAPPASGTILPRSQSLPSNTQGQPVIH